MNIPNEQSTIGRAAYALEQLTGKQVELKDDAPEVPPGTSLIADGTMVIGENSFLFDVKTALHPNTLGLVQPSVRGEHLPIVVVTGYISPAVGQELRKREVYYLDTAGNAFLKATYPALFILIQGQRQPLEARPDKGRAFRPAGLRLLYHLLNEPELLQAPYRVLADKASLSLGSVSAVLHDLRQQGLLREEGDKRRWLDAPQVVRRWVEGYGEVLKPKLGRQRYRWLTPDLGRGGWQQVPVGIDCFWGGEPAANLLLDGYLLPEVFTLYSSATRADLMRRFRLVPDAQGQVEVLAPFETTFYQYRPESRAVSPLLAYADLLLTADPRNREVAHLLHERYLSYLH